MRHQYLGHGYIYLPYVFFIQFATLQNDYFDDDEDDYNEVDDGGEGRHIYRHLTPLLLLTYPLELSPV